MTTKQRQERLNNQTMEPADKLPTADSGNASNPSPHHTISSKNNQLLSEKAEKYLAESGNIEDLPDAQEEEDAEENEK